MFQYRINAELGYFYIKYPYLQRVHGHIQRVHGGGGGIFNEVMRFRCRFLWESTVHYTASMNSIPIINSRRILMYLMVLDVSTSGVEFFLVQVLIEMCIPSLRHDSLWRDVDGRLACQQSKSSRGKVGWHPHCPGSHLWQPSIMPQVSTTKAVLGFVKGGKLIPLEFCSLSERVWPSSWSGRMPCLESWTSHSQ